MSVYDRISKCVPGLSEGMEALTAYNLIAERLEAFEKAVKKMKPALVIAYEDSGDRYFLNVIDEIEEILDGRKTL